MRILGLIAARGGSKRVPNKNIKLLDGKPLIAYTIEAALKSAYIDKVIVSTDSEQIAEVAKKYGAEVPFIRPLEISGDTSTEYEYHKHAVEFLEKNQEYVADLIVNLYPTTPFRKTSSIDAAIKLMLETGEADSLRSVIKCSEHPYKMWEINEDKFLKPFINNIAREAHTAAYKTLPEVFIQNASIYILKNKVLLETKSTIGNKILKYEMSAEESVDINNPIDFDFAEFLIKR